MPSGAVFDVATSGKRVRHRVVVALALCLALPLLVLMLVVAGYVVPALDPSNSVTFFGLPIVLVVTLLGMIVGGVMIWRMGRTMTTIATVMSRDPNLTRIEGKTDEVGSLLGNFSKLFETIEQQANEINRFATRLDAAYKELESTHTRLRETSFKDEVTGLYNRRFFNVRLEEELSRHRRFNHPVSVVLLDLDGFKAVNDEMGHTVGDDTLRDVSQILRKHSRGINVVSRYGGDEFAVLLVETSKAGAHLYAERIRDVIARFRFKHGKPITASLGIASLPDDDVSSGDDLFKMADEALYTAKRSGKNQVGALAPTPERER
jgi:diguanylate cyclase (GGDEF)-like protein